MNGKMKQLRVISIDPVRVMRIATFVPMGLAQRRRRR